MANGEETKYDPFGRIPVNRELQRNPLPAVKPGETKSAYGLTLAPALQEAAQKAGEQTVGQYEMGMAGSKELAEGTVRGLGLGAEAYGETGAALMGDINTPAPPVTPPAPALATNMPAPAAALAPAPVTAPATAATTTTGVGKPTRSLEDITKEVKATTTVTPPPRPAGEISLAEPRRNAFGLIEGEGKVLATVPKTAGIAPGTKDELAQQMDDLLNKVLSPGRGGLKRSQAATALGILGEKVKREGHATTSEGLLDYRKANLEAKIAQNQLMHNDLMLKMQQQRDINQSKLAEAHYQKFVAPEIDPMTGKTMNNELHTMLNMGFSGLPVPEPFRPNVERAMKGFEDYYKKGLGKGQDTPPKRFQALQAYKKWTSILRPPEEK